MQIQIPFPPPDPNTFPVESPARPLFDFIAVFLLAVNLALLILPERVREWIFGKRSGVR